MRANFKHSEKTKEKMRLAKLGKPSPWKGKTGRYTQETLNKFSLAHTGKKLSQEHKFKIGLKSTGKLHTQESKDKISLKNKGKVRSDETKLKISTLKKGIRSSPRTEFKKGSVPWNFKGGITPINQKIRNSEEYKLWRQSVFQRDRFTCVWCGYRSHTKINGKSDIHADHIKPFSQFPELRFAIDNGRTLCVPCHHKTATWGMGATKNLNI